MTSMEGTTEKTQNEPQAPPLRSYGSVGRSNRLSTTIAQFEQHSQTNNNTSPIPKRSSPPVKLSRQLPPQPKTPGNNIEKSRTYSEPTSTNSLSNQRAKSRTIGPALAKQLNTNGEDKPADIRDIFANTEPDNNNNTNQQPDFKNTVHEDESKNEGTEFLRRSRGASESHVKRAAVFTTIRMTKDKIDNQLSKPLPPPPQLNMSKTAPNSPTPTSPRVALKNSSTIPNQSKKPLPSPTSLSISSYPVNSDTSQIRTPKPLPAPSSNPPFVEDTNVDITEKKPLPTPSIQVSMDDSSINYQSNHTLEKKGRKLSFRGSLDSRKEKDNKEKDKETAEETSSSSSSSSSTPINPRERSKTLKRLITTKLLKKEEPTQISPPRTETISEPVSPSGPSTFETPTSEAPQSPSRTKSSRKLPQINKNTFRFLKQSKSKNNMNSKLAEHLREAEAEITSMFGSLIDEFEKMDIWTTRPHVDKNWNEVEQEEHLVEPEIRCLLNTDRAKAEGFRFEFGRNFVVYANYTPLDKSGELILDVEDAQKDIPYYLEFFADKSNPVSQFHYMTDGEEDRVVGPIVITIEAPTVSGMNPISSHMSFNSSLQVQEEDKRAIIRSKKGTERIFIPASQCNGKTAMIKYIKSIYPELAGVKLTKMPSFLQDGIEKKLVEFEKQSIIKRYKFGLLYAKDGQTDENQMFSNTETSPDYEEFLGWLGEKITLKGWSKYRGGLDVKTNTTGTHSVYTEHRGYEVMFHVSTLLPFQPDDLQRVERKRHLGNDVVVLIFKEGDTPFDPLCLTTHFNHVFVVISKEMTFTEAPHYRIAIANKLGVPPYSPYLNSPAVYPKNDEFRDLLLTKLINGERASMHAPDFRGKMLRTNKTLLEDMAKDFIQKSKEKPKPSEKSETPLSSSPTHGTGLLNERPSASSTPSSSNRSSKSLVESPVISELS